MTTTTTMKTTTAIGHLRMGDVDVGASEDQFRDTDVVSNRGDNQQRGHAELKPGVNKGEGRWSTLRWRSGGVCEGYVTLSRLNNGFISSENVRLRIFFFFFLIYLYRVNTFSKTLIFNVALFVRICSAYFGPVLTPTLRSTSEATDTAFDHVANTTTNTTDSK